MLYPDKFEYKTVKILSQSNASEAVTITMHNIRIVVPVGTKKVRRYFALHLAVQLVLLAPNKKLPSFAASF